MIGQDARNVFDEAATGQMRQRFDSVLHIGGQQNLRVAPGAEGMTGGNVAPVYNGA